MILLDTNIVSALMRPAPQPAVIDWLDRRDTPSLYLSAVTIAEIGFGLRSLPHGKRRRTLQDRFQLFLDRGFEGRTLPFDARAAFFYSELMGHRREIGRPMSVLDGQIAAIARAHRFTIATGNVRDFEACGLEIRNPFVPES